MAELNGKQILGLLTKGRLIKTQEKTIFQNGVVTPDEGYAFSKVTVNVPQPDLDYPDVSYMENGDYTLEPREGYGGLSGARITVNVPQPDLDYPDVSYMENGDYTLEPREGYGGLSGARITVNVPTYITVANEDELPYDVPDGTIAVISEE